MSRCTPPGLIRWGEGVVEAALTGATAERGFVTRTDRVPAEGRNRRISPDCYRGRASITYRKACASSGTQAGGTPVNASRCVGVVLREAAVPMQAHGDARGRVQRSSVAARVEELTKGATRNRCQIS